MHKAHWENLPLPLLTVQSVDERRHIRLGHLTLFLYLVSTQDLSISRLDIEVRLNGITPWPMVIQL